jgi:(p)ppGpp synthase/HD superfamily hydrolase
LVRHIPLTGRLAEAVSYAAVAHAGQVRKGTDVPYLSHLLSVAALALEHGGDEVQATAGVLHDVVEDCGGLRRLEDVRAVFGDEVATLVHALSDAAPVDGAVKKEWKPRKEAYLVHLGEMVAADHPATLVSLCDKLHNARAIVADASDEAGLGAGVWDRFTGTAAEAAWYYRTLAEVFRTGRLPARAVAMFDVTVAELARLAEEAQLAGEPG